MTLKLITMRWHGSNATDFINQLEEIVEIIKLDYETWDDGDLSTLIYDNLGNSDDDTFSSLWIEDEGDPMEKMLERIKNQEYKT